MTEKRRTLEAGSQGGHAGQAGVDSSAEPHRGQMVLAGREAVGEILEVLTHHGLKYLHVQRYGPGFDDLYIPMTAVTHMVDGHVYVCLTVPDLVAEPWHERPGERPPSVAGGGPASHPRAA